MSSRSALAVALTGVMLVLSACGFQPLYGERPTTRAETNLASITVDVIADRAGQMLRNELGTRLDPNNQGLAPQYQLKVKLQESISRLAVRRDASATRANLTLKADYTLQSIKGAAAVYSGSVRSVNSYDILGTENEFGTLAAREEARRRASRDLADQIAVRLALALEQQSRGNQPKP